MVAPGSVVCRVVLVEMMCSIWWTTKFRIFFGHFGSLPAYKHINAPMFPPIWIANGLDFKTYPLDALHLSGSFT